MKNAFKFLGKDTGEAAGNAVFGITILFAAMAFVIALLGAIAACCHGKCCKKCCVCMVSIEFKFPSKLS